MTAAARTALALAALALAAAGCGPAREDAEPALELWAMGREGEAARRLAAEFERRHPPLRVRVQQVPWSAAHEKLLTAWVGGALPDVFQLGTTWIPELAAIGALEPLDARIAASTAVAEADFFAGVLAASRVDGTTWAVPWYVDTRLLFYRADLLAAAGHRDAPRTWAEWLAALEAVARRAGAGRHALLLPFAEWEPLVALAHERGAALLREGGRYGDFRAPAFREAFAFYVDLFRRGLAPRDASANVVSLAHDFADARFAMLVTGPWNLGEFARRLPPELADAWATAPMPASTGPGPGLSLALGASLAIRRGTPRADEAWRLVAWLAEPAQQLEFHRLTGDLPSRRSAWDDPRLAGDPRARAFLAQLARVRPVPAVPEWERIAKRIARYAEAAVRDEMAIDEALAALDADVDAILEKRRWLLARGVRPPG